MPAYWIAHVTVTDAQQYPQYMALAKPALQQYGARFLARGEQAQTLEGQGFSKHVVMEFRDYDTALACYHSEAYQQARRARQDAAEVMITIVDGVAG